MRGKIKILDQEIELDTINQTTKLIQEEIDWVGICELMIECGWTKVETSWDCQSIEDALDLKEWCTKNIQEHYKARGKIWLFANQKDAVKFILRWL